MTNPNKTELIFLVDRSGSMHSIARDMEGGLSSLLSEQNSLPGECLVSLYTFDDKFETEYEAKPAGDAPVFSLIPRGTTALLDSMCRAITLTGERLARLPEHDRPSKLVFVTITDGQENASKEATQAQLSKMIKTQTDAYGWQFVYLAADASGFEQGSSYGVANVAQFTASSTGTQKLYADVSRSIGSYRSGGSDSVQVDPDLTVK